MPEAKNPEAPGNGGPLAPLPPPVSHPPGVFTPARPPSVDAFESKVANLFAAVAYSGQLYRQPFGTATIQPLAAGPSQQVLNSSSHRVGILWINNGTNPIYIAPIQQTGYGSAIPIGSLGGMVLMYHAVWASLVMESWYAGMNGLPAQTLGWYEILMKDVR